MTKGGRPPTHGRFCGVRKRATVETMTGLEGINLPEASTSTSDRGRWRGRGRGRGRGARTDTYSTQFEASSSTTYRGRGRGRARGGGRGRGRSGGISVPEPGQPSESTPDTSNQQQSAPDMLRRSSRMGVAQTGGGCSRWFVRRTW